MADFSEMMKSFLNKSGKALGKAAVVAGKGLKSAAEATGKAANTAVSATKYKVDELSNSRQRSELIALLGEKVYSLVKDGMQLPEELNDLLNQIAALEQEQDARRAEHQAEKLAAAQAKAEAKAAKNAAKVDEAIDAGTAPVEFDAPMMDVESDAPAEHTETPADVPTLNVTDDAE